jgi:predicted nucleotidyltransferase
MPKMTLEQLVERLRTAHAENLRAVVLYGSAAVGEHISNLSDVNVLVLVERLGLPELDREAELAAAWARAGNPPPLTLTVEEWNRCADVFPMEYRDILERHRVLHGEPPFASVEVDRKHLRLQAEQEAMGKLIRLRQGVLGSGGDLRGLEDLLTASLSTFMVIARAVLRLHGERPPDDYEALSRAAGAIAGFDADPFVRIVHHRRGDNRLSREEIRPVLAGYLAGAQRLFVHLDTLDAK